MSPSRILLSVFAGLIVLAYPLQQAWIYRPWPDQPGTHFFSALGLFLIFLGLALKPVGRQAPVASNRMWIIATVIGLWRIFEIAAGVTILDAIQSQFVPDTVRAPTMGALTAISQVALAGCLVAALRNMGRTAQMLFAVALAVTATSLTGYIIGYDEYRGEMALVTTAGMLLACGTALSSLRSFEPVKYLFAGQSYSRRMIARLFLYNFNIFLLALVLTRFESVLSTFAPLILVTIIAVQIGIFLQGTRSYVTTVEREAEQIEDLARLNEEANAANAAKSQFLAIISHELRTPLTGIVGITDLMRLTKLNAEQRKQLDELSESAAALSTLLNEILDFSKIEAGKLDLELTPVSVADLMGSVANLFQPLAQEKGLALNLYADGLAQDSIVADSTRVRQTVANVISNAVKFTQSGRIDIRVSQQVFGQDSVRTKIAVADTGIDIPPDRLKTIFDPFKQADGSTTRQFGGTGLGLSIAKSLLEKMNGSIAVESVEGEGSTFTIEFVAQAATAAQERDIEKARHEASARANELADQFETEQGATSLSGLVTDDNEPIRRLVTTVMEKAGHTVDAACDGQEAVAKCRAKTYDFILMDMHMPVMNGIEASTQIRKEERERGTAPVPIIAVTADLQESTKKKCAEAGIDRVIAKPINWGQLLTEIRGLAGQVEPTPRAVSTAAATSAVAPAGNGADSAPADETIIHFEDYPTLSMEVIDGLEQALGGDIVRPMLANFKDSLDKHVVALADLCSEGDLDKAKKEGHAIKGLCRQFGALRCGEIGAFIEMTAQDIPRIEEMVTLLEKELPDVDTQLSGYLSAGN